MRLKILIGCLLFFSCTSVKKISPVAKSWQHRSSGLTGTAFYHQAAAMNWAARDSFVLAQAAAGN
ncbi:MAG: hypothetical protein IT248_10240, partial [Chitinophagaceae bacterium]|nr:hypothetical protein [Chitinophagaceae bacterium]